MVHSNNVHWRDLESHSPTTASIQRPRYHRQGCVHIVHGLTLVQFNHDNAAVHHEPWRIEELTYTSNRKPVLPLHVAIVRSLIDERPGIRRACLRSVARDHVKSTFLDLRRVHLNRWHWTLPYPLLSRQAHVHPFDDPVLDSSHLPSHAFWQHREQY